MLEGQLRVADFLHFNHQRDSALGVAERKWFPRVLMRDRVHASEIRVGTALHDSAADLNFLVGIVKVHDGKRDPRVASRVLRFQRAFAGADDEMLAFPSDPDRHGLRRTVRHERGEMGEVRAIDEILYFGRGYGRHSCSLTQITNDTGDSSQSRMLLESGRAW